MKEISLMVICLLLQKDRGTSVKMYPVYPGEKMWAEMNVSSPGCTEYVLISTSQQAELTNKMWDYKNDSVILLGFGLWKETMFLNIPKYFMLFVRYNIRHELDSVISVWYQHPCFIWIIHRIQSNF